VPEDDRPWRHGSYSDLEGPCCPLLPLRQPTEAVKLVGWRPGPSKRRAPPRGRCLRALAAWHWPTAPKREKQLLSRSARDIQRIKQPTPSRSVSMWNPRTNTIIIVIRFHTLESSDLQKSRYPVPCPQRPGSAAASLE
jgi:hypothetical protein